MSDAQLALSASNVATALSRDIADFARFALTSGAITAFRAQCSAFQLLPGDDDLSAAITKAIATKDELRAEVKELLQDMLVRFADKFGSDSAELARLGASSLDELGDAEMLLVLRRVRQVAAEYQSLLAAHGVDNPLLDELKSKADAFEQALNTKFEAESARIQQTRKRIREGNALYERLNTYCNMGKRVYRNKDYAKYADYLVYKDSSQPQPLVPTNLRYENGIVRWDAIESARSYQLRLRLSSEEESNAIYSGSDTEFPFALPTPPPAGVEAYYLSVRAHNAGGFGNPSAELRLDLT